MSAAGAFFLLPLIFINYKYNISCYIIAYLCSVIINQKRGGTSIKMLSKTMTTYSINLCDKANSVVMARRENMADAMAYVESEMKGVEIAGGDVNPFSDLANISWYEIWGVDEEGEPTELAHQSQYFYN